MCRSKINVRSCTTIMRTAIALMSWNTLVTNTVAEPVVLVGSLEGSFLASFALGWGVTIGTGLASYPLDTIRYVAYHCLPLTKLGHEHSCRTCRTSWFSRGFLPRFLCSRVVVLPSVLVWLLTLWILSCMLPIITYHLQS
jgi:hypothetical protein